MHFTSPPHPPQLPHTPHPPHSTPPAFHRYAESCVRSHANWTAHPLFRLINLQGNNPRVFLSVRALLPSRPSAVPVPDLCVTPMHVVIVSFLHFLPITFTSVALLPAFPISFHLISSSFPTSRHFPITCPSSHYLLSYHFLHSLSR